MKPKLVCFDACDFIALHRKGQPRRDEIVSAMRSIFAQIDSGQMIGIASTIIVAELLDQSYDALMHRMDSKRGYMIEPNEEIVRMARAIRNKIVRGPKRLDLPDCIYIATAAAYGCDALITVEGLDNGQHKMLNAAPEIAKHFGVKVCTPMEMATQPTLDLETLDLKEDEP